MIAHLLNNAIAIVLSRARAAGRAGSDSRDPSRHVFVGGSACSSPASRSPCRREGAPRERRRKLRFTTLALRRAMASEHDELAPIAAPARRARTAPRTSTRAELELALSELPDEARPPTRRAPAVARRRAPRA